MITRMIMGIITIITNSADRELVHGRSRKLGVPPLPPTMNMMPFTIAAEVPI
jgi:hypothetical protein